MVQSFPAPRFFWVPLGPKFWNSGGKCRSPDWPQNADAHFVGACAVEMYFNISQEPLYTEIYRKNAAAQIEPRHTCENDFQVKDLLFLHTILDITWPHYNLTTDDGQLWLQVGIILTLAYFQFRTGWRLSLMTSLLFQSWSHQSEE